MKSFNKSFQYENGLVLLFEEMDWSQSFAIEISTAAGSVFDPPTGNGLAALTCEMTNRGAAGYDKRRFLDTLENLGIETSEQASRQSAIFRSTGLIDNWERALELMCLQIREPTLSEEEFDDCRRIQLLEIIGVEDEPKVKSALALNSLLVPDPWGKPVNGTVDSVSALTNEDVRSFHQRFYRPNGTVVALAGHVNWERAKEKVGQLFGDWKPLEEAPIKTIECEKSTIQIESNTEQTHIRLGFQEVPFGDPDYWRASSGIDVLSGGMSSRLFTEVREKRGLCYNVHASHFTLGPYGGVACYCGTTSEKAQQSLDVIIREIDKLSEIPITNSEMSRMKIRAKSSIVMQRESTLKRVAAMIGDWRYLKRVRSLEETLAIYDRMTKEEIESYFIERPMRKFRLATVGVNPLQLPQERLY